MDDAKRTPDATGPLSAAEWQSLAEDGLVVLTMPIPLRIAGRTLGLALRCVESGLRTSAYDRLVDSPQRFELSAACCSLLMCLCGCVLLPRPLLITGNSPRRCAPERTRLWDSVSP